MKYIICDSCGEVIEAGETMYRIDKLNYCEGCTTEYTKVDDTDIENFGTETRGFEPDAMEISKEMIA